MTIDKTYGGERDWAARETARQEKAAEREAAKHLSLDEKHAIARELRQAPIRAAQERKAAMDKILADREAREARRREEMRASAIADAAARIDMGQRLRTIRESIPMNQTEMALWLGYDQPLVSRLENGRATGLRSLKVVEEKYLLAAKLASGKARAKVAE